MDRNGGIIKVEGIKRKRINALGAADHLIRKRNARPSISNAPNAIKPVIGGLCAGPKRRIKMIKRKRGHLSRIDPLLQGSH
jgi:hypothetical protein